MSYASEDRDTVDDLVEELKARGIRVWQDRQNLRAGDNWRRALRDVITTKADYVIVVQTTAMTTRIKGVFQWEIEAALEQQTQMGEFEGQRLRFVIPVKIGAVTPLSSLNASHIIDIGEPRGVELLVESIQEDWGRREALRSLGGVIA